MEHDPRRSTGGNRRGRRSREEILEVASRLMAERGYAATSLSVLGAETGLPKSAVYHHFHSKAGLLTAVMERGLHDFFHAMREAHANPPSGGTHRERMAWYLERTGEVFTARQEFLRLHMILILSAEAEEVEVADTITKVRDEGRLLMNTMIRSTFSDLGDEIAAAVADELDHFGIAGFDGAFIAMQADPSRALGGPNAHLAEALVLLGERIAARLRDGGDPVSP
ncbi:TetR/AcrR family transcriptional regulator [Nocardioides nematodiphilus]|uniref:TetR/AcrR family transcriptional regulator n=1 Tax=Nocardioides nematodiphilus TaxID=2849669 RepID=UPI001CD95C25|nr:TetR/AcrR family transcriptional regulator [Nocardioides nematodiphilus]MCA1983230.1 TetR/AcrR family transcriptional regulator [Nocardioides nematodiphilus]